MMDIKCAKSDSAFYAENADFKDYVDKCVKTYNKSVEDIFKSPITQEYRKSLEDGGCNAKNKGKEG